MKPEDLYKLALSLFEEGHDDDGVLVLEKCANEGFAEAQYLLANLIREERVARPLQEMVMWYSKAAEQNHLFAINNLAICYHQGYGTEVNFEKAFGLLRKAFSLGDVMAGFNIGQAYCFGLGVAKDIEKGFDYVYKAAQHDCPNAQFMLGELFEKGIQDAGFSIDANLDSAIKWYERAAQHGNGDAIEALERLETKRNDKPIIDVLPSNEIVVRADVLLPNSYTEDEGKYINADEAVSMLLAQARKGANPKALDILMELSGKYMNKCAFNALNELGQIGDVTDDSTRQGFARYMLEAWKSCDREKLEMLAFWTCPSFEYTEYDTNNKLILKITQEKEFVDHLMSEMINAQKNGKQIQMRLNKCGGDYMTDIMIGDAISTFKFLFGEKTFIGISRFFQ